MVLTRDADPLWSCTRYTKVKGLQPKRQRDLNRRDRSGKLQVWHPKSIILFFPSGLHVLKRYNLFITAPSRHIMRHHWSRHILLISRVPLPPMGISITGGRPIPRLCGYCTSLLWSRHMRPVPIVKSWCGWTEWCGLYGWCGWCGGCR